MIEYGYHGDNYVWLEPLGLIHGVPQQGDIPDVELWDRVFSRARGAAHYKQLIATYPDRAWIDVQHARLTRIFRELNPKTFTFRLSPNDVQGTEDQVAFVIREVASAANAVHWRGTAYFEMGNEWNLIPGLTAAIYAGQAVSILAVVRRVSAELGFPILALVAALSPTGDYLSVYDDADYRACIAAADGAAVHIYDGTDVETLLNKVGGVLTSLGKDPMERLVITEIGSTRPDRVGFFKKVAGLGFVNHIFIIDGSPGRGNPMAWPPAYVMTDDECAEMREDGVDPAEGNPQPPDLPDVRTENRYAEFVAAGVYGGRGEQVVDTVVIHGTGSGRDIPTSQERDGAVNWFLGSLRRGHSEASAHAVIDEYGLIVECIPIHLAAWHAGSRNPDLDLNRRSIGVELCQPGPVETLGHPITDAQYRSLAWYVTNIIEPVCGSVLDFVEHKATPQGRFYGKSDPWDFSFARFGDELLRQHGQQTEKEENVDKAAILHQIDRGSATIDALRAVEIRVYQLEHKDLAVEIERLGDQIWMRLVNIKRVAGIEDLPVVPDAVIDKP